MSVEGMMQRNQAGIAFDSPRRSMKESIEDKKERLESQLKEVNEALDSLKANPELERVLNLVSKVL